jgi:hypothetical protein
VKKKKKKKKKAAFDRMRKRDSRREIVRQASVYLCFYYPPAPAARPESDYSHVPIFSVHPVLVCKPPPVTTVV